MRPSNGSERNGNYEYYLPLQKHSDSKDRNTVKQYLHLVDSVIYRGEVREDRTGTGTISIFGTQSRYDLHDGFPLCTTKKVNFKAVVAELLWMLRGETNTKTLDAKIWDEWADENGELGPIYGAQWRHWGLSTKRSLSIHHGDGIDQIQVAIDTIKNNPESRRIIVSAWNPDDVPRMALPPCHMFFQFYVRNGYLDCQMYQRSADLALGVPFNVASYALLTTLIANMTGLKPGVFVHTIGDCHIYLNHLEGMKEQLKREPRPLPTLTINSTAGFNELYVDDFTISGYNPHPPIKFEISV